MYMFNEKTGEKVAEKVYNDLMAHENVELWYDNYAVIHYDIDACWDRAASEAMDRLHLDHCEVTGLMAWIIATSPDDANTAFNDGFGYLLGNALQSVYELKED